MSSDTPIFTEAELAYLAMLRFGRLATGVQARVITDDHQEAPAS